MALRKTIDRLQLDLEGIRNAPPALGSFGSGDGGLLLKDGMLRTLEVELGESMSHGLTTTAVVTPVDGEADAHEDCSSKEPIITRRVGCACGQKRLRRPNLCE